MADTFQALIDEYGVPRLLTVNSPRFVWDNKKSGGWSTSRHPEASVDPFGPRTWYYRIPYGNDPFLLIRSYLAVPVRRFQEVRTELEALHIIEFRPGIMRGPRRGTIAAKEVAVAADVDGLSRQALRRAAAEGRVLNVHSYRSMGDGSVTLDVCGPDLQELQVDKHGYHFVFEPPCRLTYRDLPHDEAQYAEHEWTYLDGYWQRYFVRAFPLPPEPVRASRARRRSP